MQQGENLVKELLSKVDSKKLLELYRLFYDTYVEANSGGIDPAAHTYYRALEQFIEKLPRKT